MFPCLDAARRARDNRFDYFDRSVTGEYRTRVADGRAGLSLEGYAVQFVRAMPQLAIAAPRDGVLPGGMALSADLTNYRSGAMFDGDVEVGGQVQLLYGAEGFHEWLPRDVSRSRQGDGIEVTFLGPYTSHLDFLPLSCPQRIDAQGNVAYLEGCPLTMAFPASRTVFGAYLNPRWRPTKKLTLDAGARAQAAPRALGLQGYDPQFLLSGTAFYNFVPGWHLKLNYAEGFRPPGLEHPPSAAPGVLGDARSRWTRWVVHLVHLWSTRVGRALAARGSGQTFRARDPPVLSASSGQQIGYRPRKPHGNAVSQLAARERDWKRTTSRAHVQLTAGSPDC